MTLLILTNHSVWLPPLLENSKSTFKTITLISSIICLVTYILLEIGKLLFLFEFWLKKKDVLWLAVLNLSTIYISQESLTKSWIMNKRVIKSIAIGCIRQSRYGDYSSTGSHSDNLVVDLCYVYFGWLPLHWNLPHNAQECCQSPYQILSSLLLHHCCIFIGLSSSCSWNWAWKSSPLHTNNFR